MHFVYSIGKGSLYPGLHSSSASLFQQQLSESTADKYDRPTAVGRGHLFTYMYVHVFRDPRYNTESTNPSHRRLFCKDACSLDPSANLKIQL